MFICFKSSLLFQIVSIAAKLIHQCIKSENLFSLYFVKYSLQQKLFHTKAWLTDTYILGYVVISYKMGRFQESRLSCI
jgi:hypothetical protein